MKTSINKFLKEDILLGIAVAIVLCFFAPLDFYYSNKSDVWYDVYNILPAVLGVTGITFLVISFLLLVARLIPKVGGTVNGVLRFVIIFMLVALYIQGNYITTPYGALNGTPIVWDDYKVYDWLSVVFWCGIFVILIMLAFKLSPKQRLLAERWLEIALIFIAFFALTMEYVFGDGGEYKFEKGSGVDNEWTYSSDTNFNILILDCFDSRLFTSMLRNDEEFREMTNKLDGFTFYRDTLGAYNLTDYAIPTILTGQLYLAETTYGDYIEEAFEKSALLNKLSEAGYSNNVYSTITLPQGKASEEIDNLSRIRFKPIYSSKFIIDMYKTVAFRYAPTPLKKHFYSSYFEIAPNKTTDKDKSDINSQAYDWYNIVWNGRYQGEDFEMVDTNMFHLYHLEGIHEPRQYHSNFEFTSNPEEVSIEEAAVLNMKIVVEWIEMLKSKGVYDNSVIVIMGDHGTSRYETEVNVAQTPLLLIKGTNENHEPVVNNLPVSYLDLQDEFVSLIEGNAESDSFENVCSELQIEDSNAYIQTWESLINDDDEIPDTVGRWRLFYFSYFMNEMGTNSTGGPFHECATDTVAYSEEGLRSTGNEY